MKPRKADMFNIDDHSEFPSLSGTSQPQYANPSQAIWANANQRAIQHTPVQRPQQQHLVIQQATTQPSQPQQTQQTQDAPHQTTDELFSPMSRFAGGMEEYRHGGQGGIGQLPGSVQPQTGNIEEFPPLGRNGNDDAGHDQRSNLTQNAAFGGFSSASGFNFSSNSVQSRHGLPNASSSQSETSRASTLAGRSLSPSHRGFGGALLLFSMDVYDIDVSFVASTSRSPADLARQGQAGALDHEQNVRVRSMS